MSIYSGAVSLGVIHYFKDSAVGLRVETFTFHITSLLIDVFIVSVVCVAYVTIFALSRLSATQRV